jgi:ribosomal-protein-alanine N-acetyltransferase
MLKEDVDRISAELGFWLGEPFWGRGIMTEAVRAFVPWAFERFSLSRIYAQVFAFNTGSARVLEKAGFILEATLRRSAIKDGMITDQFQFVRLRAGG